MQNTCRQRGFSSTRTSTCTSIIMQCLIIMVYSFKLELSLKELRFRKLINQPVKDFLTGKLLIDFNTYVQRWEKYLIITCMETCWFNDGNLHAPLLHLLS